MAIAIGMAVWALTTRTEAVPTTQVDEEWFIYVGGPVNQPGSYEMVETDPDCPGTGTLCAIRAQKQENADLPTTSSLANLASISNNFANEVEGLVEHRAP